MRRVPVLPTEHRRRSNGLQPQARFLQAGAGLASRRYATRFHCQQLGLAGLGIRIRSQDDMEACASVASARSARKAVAEHAPDVVIVDLALKGEGGLMLIKSIGKVDPDVRIVVFSAYDGGVYAGRAQRAGAHGYVNKQEPSANILEAIRTVAGGQVYRGTPADAAIAGRSDQPGGPGGIEMLSDRELEIFQLIGHGHGSHEIAERLHVSQNTVGTHKENIRRKLGAKNSTELLQQAVRWVLENR
jgi:DNA-binding NarL/FixJ family response regulator